MDKRYFEFHGADAKRGTTSSSKFWEVWVEGSTLYTRFGKIGAIGQTTVKEFPTPEKAEAALEKTATEKTKKGYEERIGEKGKISESSDIKVGNFDLDDAYEYAGAYALKVHRESNAGIAEYAEKQDEGYRAMAASSLGDALRLEQLGRDSSPAVRQRVAGNRYSPAATLWSLAHDKERSVREAAAGNEFTPHLARIQLGNEDDSMRDVVEANSLTAVEPGSPEPGKELVRVFFSQDYLVLSRIPLAEANLHLNDYVPDVHPFILHLSSSIDPGFGDDAVDNLIFLQPVGIGTVDRKAEFDEVCRQIGIGPGETLVGTVMSYVLFSDISVPQFTRDDEILASVSWSDFGVEPEGESVVFIEAIDESYRQWADRLSVP